MFRGGLCLGVLRCFCFADPGSDPFLDQELSGEVEVLPRHRIDRPEAAEPRRYGDSGGFWVGVFCADVVTAVRPPPDGFRGFRPFALGLAWAL